MDYIIAAFAGCLLTLLGIGGWMMRRSRRQTGIQTVPQIMEMRSVGELVVFKVVTKEIVTASEHWFGDIGKNYFSWLISGKKMAMIFEFGIDFKYDLRSKDFIIEEQGNGKVNLRMPGCEYETYLRDLSFYDEQNARLLPGLLPDVIGKLFGLGFNEEDKNRLKEAARQQAEALASAMAKKVKKEVQLSAEQTLRVLAHGFGAKKITLDFADSGLVLASKADVRFLERIEKSPPQLPEPR